MFRRCCLFLVSSICCPVWSGLVQVKRGVTAERERKTCDRKHACGTDADHAAAAALQQQRRRRLLAGVGRGCCAGGCTTTLAENLGPSCKTVGRSLLRHLTGAESHPTNRPPCCGHFPARSRTPKSTRISTTAMQRYICTKGGCDHTSCEETQLESLFAYVDTNRVRCLNERQAGSARLVLRPFEERLNMQQFVESAEDDELLMFIPFSVAVKIKAIRILGTDDLSSPAHVRLFVNREDLDIGSAHDATCAQEFDLLDDCVRQDEADYPLKPAKFMNVHQLALLFRGNFGADHSRIRFIQVKGEGSANRRETIKNVVYEAKPMLSDHDVRVDKFVPRTL